MTDYTRLLPRVRKDWRKLIRYAWSIRLLGIAGIFSGFEVALPFLQNVLPVPLGVFAGLSALATGGAFVARLLAQKQFGGND